MIISALVAAPMVLVSPAAPGVETAPPRALESKADEALRLTRVMAEDLLKAEKAVIAKFKTLPEADDIRIHFAKNMYGWSVSDKCLANRREEMDAALASYQKEFKDTALVDELRLFAKKVAKNSQDNLPLYEGRLAKAQKELKEGKAPDKDGKLVDLTEYDRKTREGLLRILPLEVEYQQEARRIAVAYAAALTKLMD
jgi:hypothetical protein